MTRPGLGTAELTLHGGTYSRVSGVVLTLSIPQAVLRATADGVVVEPRHVLARVLGRGFAREVGREDWVPSGTLWSEPWSDVVEVRARGRRLGLVNRAGDRCKFTVSRRRTMDELVALLTGLGIQVEPLRPTYRFMAATTVPGPELRDRSQVATAPDGAEVSTPPADSRRMRSWAAIGQGTVLGGVLAAVGLLVGRGAGLPSPGLVIAAALVSLGVWRLVTLPFSGAYVRGGKVRYQAAGARAVVVRAHGQVEIESRMFLPFVHLHELVVHHPDGSRTLLPWASAASWRRAPSLAALRSRERLQAWLDEGA